MAVLIWGILKPEDISSREDAAKLPMPMMIYTVGPILLIGPVITVAIYAGIATPTEAAAVAALLTVILAFDVGGLTWDGCKAETGPVGLLPDRFEPIEASRQRLSPTELKKNITAHCRHMVS